MIEQINNLAANWWGWMWPMFWQVGLLIVVIGLVDLLVRRRVWPQVRYALWLLVLVKLVVPPSLALPTSLTSGFGPLAWGIVQHQPLAEQTEAASVEQGVAAGPAVDVEATAVMEPEIAAVQEAMPMDAAVRNPELTVRADPAPAVGPAISWQGYAMLSWLVGVLILTGWLAVRFWQLRRGQLGETGSVEKPQWFEELLAETARKLRLGRLPEVVLSSTTVSPAVFGVFRPVLLIPAEDIKQLSRTEIEHVLLHELAHIKRGDLIVHGFNMLLQIVYWFNPLLWVVRRQLQHLRELCCDASVARILRERVADYRETLLETARRMLAKPVGPGMGLLGLFENANRLVVRLKWLEKNSWKHRGLQIAVVFAVIVLMCVCVLPMAEGQAKETTAAVTEESATKPSETLTFGPVIERVVNSTGESENCFINFDTGELFSPSTKIKFGQDFEVWMREKGVDAGAETAEGEEGLWGFDMVVIPLPSKYGWQTPPSSLRKVFAEAKGGTPAVMSAMGQLPAIYAIKTREGGMGILQIVGFSENPKGVKIRYKMVEKIQPGTQQTASTLALCIVANKERVGTHSPALFPQQLQECTKLLSEEGPGSLPDSLDHFRWVEVVGQMPPMAVLATYEGKEYVLVSNAGWRALVSKDGKDDSIGRWGLTKVAVERDTRGHPSISFELSEQAAKHFSFMTEKFVGLPLAVIVDDKVLSAPIIMTKLLNKGMITGDFTEAQAQSLAKALLAGMPATEEAMRAIHHKELDRVKELLDANPYLVRASYNEHGSTLLHLAAGGGQPAAIELLLDHGADIEAKGSYGRTPLHSAAESGQVESIKALLARGADIEALNANGLTPLHETVAEDSYKDAAEVLLDAGADINAKGQTEMTPLTLAAILTGLYSYGGHDDYAAKGKDCIELLLARGAKHDLFSACALDNIDLVRRLIQENPAVVNTKALRGISPLVAAAFWNQLDIAKLLIQNGAEVNPDSFVPPLSIAAGKGSIELMNLLLEKGARIDALDRDGGKAIHVAAYQGQNQAIETLLKAGEDVNAKDKGGRMPLHYAALGGQPNTVELLLAKGADIKAVNRNGRTALHEVVRGGMGVTPPDKQKEQLFIETAQLLIAKGIDVNAKDRNDRTPLTEAANMRNYWRHTAPLRAKFVRILVENGANVNIRDDNQGYTPLHYTVQNNDLEAVKILLNAGADPLAETRPENIGLRSERPVDLVNPEKQKAIFDELMAVAGPRIEAEKKDVEQALKTFLEAVRENNEAARQKVTLPTPHWPERRWVSYAGWLRDAYANSPELLTDIVGIETRSDWATAMISQPQGQKDKYVIFTLLQTPGGQWKLIYHSSTSRTPSDVLKGHLRNNATVLSSEREKIYEADSQPKAAN